MLSHCRAFAIAHTSTQNRGLLHLAETVGFGFVGSIMGERRVAIEAKQREIVFFLAHYGLGPGVLQTIVQHLRRLPIDAIRYAPVMVIANDAPFETILQYVRLGVDDVVTLPEKRDVLVSRFTNQLNADHTYYETESYLGPDRRRMEVDTRDERRTGTSPYTRLIIHRSVEEGVVVRRREIHGSGDAHAHQPRFATG